MGAGLPRHGAREASAQPRETRLTTEIDKLGQAFTHGKSNLRLRSFFIDQDFDNGALARTLAVGGWISYRTADFHGLGAGVTLATAQPFIYDDTAEGGAGALPPDQSGITVFSEAYLTATLGKTQFSLFRQVLDTPFLDHEDDRLIPTTYEAYGLHDRSLPHTHLELFYVNGIKQQDSDTFQSMTAVAGIEGDDQGLLYFGGRYAPEEGRFLDAYNYYCNQYMNTFYFELDYPLSLPAGLTLTPAVQYMDQRSVGDAVGGSFNTYAVGGKGQLDWDAFSLVLAFNSVGDNFGMQQPWADYPGFTGMVELDNKQAGMDSWMTALGWQKDIKQVGRISAWVFYSYAYTPDRDGTSAPRQKEFDMIVDYQPEMVRELTFTLKYTDINQDNVLGENTSQEIRLLLDWAIKLL